MSPGWLERDLASLGRGSWVLATSRRMRLGDGDIPDEVNWERNDREIAYISVVNDD